MLTPHLIQVPAPLSDKPARMPIRIQLALPDYATANQDQHLFNLPAAINDLMGTSGWLEATGVLEPHVWAPGWNLKQLQAFVVKPFGEKNRPFPMGAVSDLPARDFPWLRSLPKRQRWSVPRYDVIHFVGSIHPGGDLSLQVKSGGSWLKFGVLRDALVASATRLFILQILTEHSGDDHYSDHMLMRNEQARR